VLCFVIKIVVCRELLTSRYLYICASIACVTACVFFFFSLSLSLSLSLSIVYLFLLTRCSLPRNLVTDSRPIRRIQRIVHPSAQENLFLASSLRTRGTLCNERKRCLASR
jgi:hypothetical protein